MQNASDAVKDNKLPSWKEIHLFRDYHMQLFGHIDNVLLSHEYVNKTTEQVPCELLLAACRE